MKDFFVSYNGKDNGWAEWLAYQLEAAGYTTVIQAWDFRPGGDFILEMHRAAIGTERTIAVLSPNYLAAEYTQPEWSAAFAKDPLGKERKLVPIRITECTPGGMLSARIYIDLVGKDEQSAIQALLAGVSKERPKPQSAPVFPGQEPKPFSEGKAKPVYPPSLWNIPHQRNPFFTGREEVLGKLHQALQADNAAALSGLGGIGKTQTAVEYAYRHKDKYKTILWVKAESREMLVSDYAALAGQLGLPEKDEKDQPKAVHAVKRWLEINPNWLLILDNADDLAMAREFIPSGKKGHILLTTRAQATGTVAKKIEIDELAPEQGALFLLRRAMLIPHDADLSLVTSDVLKQAKGLSQELGGLPLALDQAAAFIDETPSTLGEYLMLFKKEGAKLLAARGQLSTDHPSVTVTFSLAFKQVEDRNMAAADLGRTCVFLAPDTIPEDLFLQGGAELGDNVAKAAASPIEFLRAVQEAGRFSLIERNPANRTVTIHRLVQTVVKEDMDEATKRQWAERAVKAVNVAFPPVEVSNWHQCEQWLPHAQVCAGLIAEWNLSFPEAARVLNQTGFYLAERARFAEAESHYQRALAIWERALGPDHIDVATSLNNLALLYNVQGRYAEAEPLFQRALPIRERALGPDHPEVAQCLNNLASHYHDQGRYGEAEPLYQRALALQERVLGPDHPDVASSLNNLAVLYRVQGRYTEAEPLYQRALAIRERVLGPDHPDVAQGLSNLAVLYRAQGRYAEPESLHQRALAIRERVLGPDHPDVAPSLNNLAVLYQTLGRYAEAAPLLQRALGILERVLGRDHPNVATCLENYANLLRRMNRETEAAELEARAQRIREKYVQNHE